MLEHVRDQGEYEINKYLVRSQDLYTNNSIQIADVILVRLGVIMCVKNPSFVIPAVKNHQILSFWCLSMQHMPSLSVKLSIYYLKSRNLQFLL